MPQVHVGEATEAVWARLLRDVDDHDLAHGVEWFLKDLVTQEGKAPRWPLPNDILAYVSKYRDWVHSRTVSGADCRSCGGLGLVRTDNYRGLSVAGLRTCPCPFGRSKAASLEEERKKGHVWTSEEMESSAEEPGKPAQTQEEIPF
jgi:hypothetical protein